MVKKYSKKPARDYAAELSPETLIEMFRYMLLARRLDERMWMLNRQGKAPFHISGIGHEAIQVAAAFSLRKDYDWVYPYYRDIAMVLVLGMTPRGLMLDLLGKAGAPSSGGRQMPEHFCSREHKLVSISSPVDTQVAQAPGTAYASKMLGKDEVTLVCFGEGSTSQGSFHEGLNWASIYKLPVVFLCQNNQYAISVPQHKEMAVENVADRAVAYNMPGVWVDGNDVLASYNVMMEAIERARNGGGPTLVEAKTYRPVPHSSDDDDRTYRSREEVEAWKKKDPILLFEKELRKRGLMDDDLRERLEAEVKAIVDDATTYALQAPYPSGEEAAYPVFEQTA